MPLTFAEVEGLHRAGELSKARAGYLELLKINPKDSQALHALALVAAEEGNLIEAEALLRQASDLDKQNLTIILHLANILKAKGELNSACHLLEGLTQSHPNFAGGFNNLGTVYFAQNKLNEAIDAYNKAIKIQANYADAYYNLGLSLQKAHRNTEALHAYEALIALNPSHPAAHFQLGRLYMQSHADTKAIEAFNVIAEQYPFHLETQINLATAYLKLGQLALAKHHYLQALTIDPNAIQALFNMAVILMQEGKIIEAVDYYLQIIKNDSDHFDAHHNLGFIFLMQKKPDQALLHYKEALRIQPSNEAIRHTLNIIKGKKEIHHSPNDYIRSLFDSYADHFDAHLAKTLHYQVPELFFTMLKPYLPKVEHCWNILDLGCGTGLCGVKLKPWAHSLTGIDLSEKMIEEARKKNLYDVLKVTEVEVFLSSQKNQYDLILAGDVLVYFGDLTNVFAKVASALRSGGLFLFDVEVGEGENYTLTPSGRFTHHKTYLDSLIQAQDLSIVSYQTAVLRTEEEQEVLGHLYLLKKPL